MKQIGIEGKTIISSQVVISWSGGFCVGVGGGWGEKFDSLNCFPLVEGIIKQSEMRRKSVKKSSMFKLQSEKNSYNRFLENIKSSPAILDNPSLEDFLTEVANTVDKYCYSFGEDNPFQRGLNYGNKDFGFSVTTSNTLIYREWIPNAKEVYLMGEFNKFSETSHIMERVEDETDTYSIELEIQKCRIKSEEKMMIKIVDKEGKQHIIPPPSCNIHDQSYGILCSSAAIPMAKNSKKQERLCAYQLNLSKIQIDKAVSYLEDNSEILKYCNTIIIKNLLTSEFVTDRYRLHIEKLKHLRDIIDLIKNSLGLKVVLEWDFAGGMKKKSDPVEDALLVETASGMWNYDLSKKEVFSRCLAHISYYLSTLQFNGIYCKNLQNLPMDLPSQIFIRCINIMNSRIQEYGFNVIETNQSIPGYKNAILEGGLGFPFFIQPENNEINTLNIEDSVALINRYNENASKSNIVKVNFDDLPSVLSPDTKRIEMNLLFVMLTSNRGFVCHGNLKDKNAMLGKSMNLKREIDLPSGLITMVKATPQIIFFRKADLLFLFNFSQESQTENIAEIIGDENYTLLSYSNEKQPILDERGATVPGSSCTVFHFCEQSNDE